MQLMPSSPPSSRSKSTIRASVPVAAKLVADSDLLALAEQHDREAALLAHAAADHVEVTRLEDAQRQRPAREQHDVQRKERQLADLDVHAGRARSASEQLLVQAAEPAVAHDQHVVAGVQVRGERGDQRRHFGRDRRFRAELRATSSRFQSRPAGW